MQTFFLGLFWGCVVTVGYTYVGYGILIALIARLKKRKKTPFIATEDLPGVTLIVAAYNEQDFIREKIENSLQLNYPASKLEFVFVTDGSTDRTPDIIREYPSIRLLHERNRRGKIHAVNRAMQVVNTPITVFCDANTYLNNEAVLNMVRHYGDPEVGGVAGEKRIFKNDTDNASGAGEGFYWRYESFLKKKDSEVYSIVGAAGELFSIRTGLYEAPPTDMIIEDFYLSLRVVARGYRFAYEPEAFAIETASASVEEEWKRKVRICAGGFQAMRRLTYLLNPFRFGLLSFQYFSHRVLRWTLAPLALVLVFIANCYLAVTNGSFFQLTLLLQLLFYGVAFCGYVLRDKSVAVKGFFVPYYFSVMNAAVYAGFVRHIRKKQSVVWERSARAEAKVK